MKTIRIRARLLRCLSMSLLFLSLFAVQAMAETYYVSQLGNDSPNNCNSAKSTTQTNQLLTISKGVACLSAGDTLYIHGGTYTGPDNVVDSSAFTVNSGTNWSFGAITIAGYPSETVIIQPPANNAGIGLNTAVEYLIFKDLVIDAVNSSGNDAQGIYTSDGANHIRFVRIEVKNSSNFGIVFSDSGADGVPTNHEVYDCLVHDNGSGTASTNGHGFYITTSGNRIEGCEIYGNLGYGFHIYNETGERDVSNNVITKNRIHGNGRNTSTASFGIVLAWGDGNLVSNNLIYNNIYGGIQVYTGSTNAMIYNNTVYGNGVRSIVMQHYDGPPSIKNNIVWNNGDDINNLGQGTPVCSNNVTLETDDDLDCDSGRVTADPSFVNAAANDFQIKLISSARNAGLALTEVPDDFEGVTRPRGASYDIGAYEWHLGPP